MFDIIPLNVATFRLTKTAQMGTHLSSENPGEISELPSIVWLLKADDGRNILVDAGPSKDVQRDCVYHGYVARSEEQQLEAALRRHKVDINHIDLVILTHLHWDHCLGVEDIPNARLVVQRTELQYAIAPIRLEMGSFDLTDTSKPPLFLRCHQRFRIVDGYCRLEEGLELVPLPGHSPGSQGVLVQTHNGKYLIAGDLVDSYHNLEKSAPTGVYTSLRDFEESLARARNIGATILPSHDYSVFDMFEVQ